MQLHEQQSLGFEGLNHIKTISQINLSGDPHIEIPSNQIVLHDGMPKVFYKVVLSYLPHAAVPSVASSYESKGSMLVSNELPVSEKYDSRALITTDGQSS